jgi:hypothetical protein
MTLTEADKLEIAALMSTALQPITERIGAIAGDVAAIAGDVAAITERVGAISGDVAAITERVGAISGDMAATTERLNLLHNEFSVVAAKAHNAACSKEDTLKKVPLSDGTVPLSESPQTILNLLVAGKEKLPNGQENIWNSKKSLELIREYDPGYETDEGTNGIFSRKRRLKLAMLLGVTSTQLNIAQLSM